MPYEKNLTVKHLKVKESEKIPFKVVNATTTLYGEDSGKTVPIPLITNPINVTLPSANKGRNLKAVLNQVGGSSVVLGANVTISVKNSGEFINTHLASIPINSGDSGDVFSTGTSTKITIIGANAIAGTNLNFVCNGSNIWTVTGYGVETNAAASNSLFTLA